MASYGSADPVRVGVHGCPVWLAVACGDCRLRCWTGGPGLFAPPPDDTRSPGRSVVPPRRADLTPVRSEDSAVAVVDIAQGGSRGSRSRIVHPGRAARRDCCAGSLALINAGSHPKQARSSLMCSALRRCLAAHVGLCVQEHVERGRLPPSRTSPPSATSATSTAARCAALTRARRATAPTAPGPPAARWTASGRSGSGASHYCPTSSAPQQHLGMWGSPVARAS